MKDIDWSKAPEEATHYCASQTFNGIKYGEHWLKPGFYCMPGCKSWVEDECRVPDDVLVCRPSASWNGEGLPPVGTVCEVMASHIHKSKWVKVEILAHAKHDKHDAVLVCELKNNGGKSTLSGVIYAPHRFRPIRTKAQIEAEERLAAINYMEIDAGMCATAFDGDPEARIWIENLIDKGWRKGEPK